MPGTVDCNMADIVSDLLTKQTIGTGPKVSLNLEKGQTEILSVHDR